MDDFSIFGSSFDSCLHHLTLVLQRCKEKNLVLNWEKCHFMVKSGIVLGHIVSSKGIEVDKAKVNLIVNLPPPKTVREVRAFLGHAGFYRRFIKDFSKIARPLCDLLAKNANFDFSATCLDSFDYLKRELTSAPIIHPPDWTKPFEMMLMDRAPPFLLRCHPPRVCWGPNGGRGKKKRRVSTFCGYARFSFLLGI